MWLRSQQGTRQSNPQEYTAFNHVGKAAWLALDAEPRELADLTAGVVAEIGVAMTLRLPPLEVPYRCASRRVPSASG